MIPVLGVVSVVTIYGIEPQPRGDAKVVIQDGDAFTLDGSEVMIVVVITRQIPHVILNIGMLSNDASDQRELEFHVLPAAGEHEQNDVHLRNPNCPLLETVTGDSPAEAGTGVGEEADYEPAVTNHGRLLQLLQLLDDRPHIDSGTTEH